MRTAADCEAPGFLTQAGPTVARAGKSTTKGFGAW